MDLSSLRGAPGSRSNRKRVGRGPGSGTGKTSGRGHKGQKSRAGYSRRAGFEGGQMPLSRRLPKRGFRHRKRFPVSIVNLDALDRVFDEGTNVTVDAIVGAGLADRTPGGVKVLGRGELGKKLTVQVNAISPSARTKIEAAGGVVDLVPVAAVAAATEVSEKTGENA